MSQACSHFVRGILIVVLIMIVFGSMPPKLASATIPTGVADTVVGNARGYLTTPQELAHVLAQSQDATNFEPYRSNINALFASTMISDNPNKWSWQGTDIESLDSNPTCSDGSKNNIPRGPLYIIEGGRLTYGKAIAAHLRTGQTAANYAQDARNRIIGNTLNLGLIGTSNWGGSAPASGDDYSGANQCILYLGLFIPAFVMAADLLEDFPQQWTASDKAAFQLWLATEVYPRVAWASRERSNNWGSVGSYAAAMIADYLWDSGLTLTEYEPFTTPISLTPAQAYAQHNQQQLLRMGTIWPGDSQCSVHGIQSSGGIPDELRRAYDSVASGVSREIPCQWTYLDNIVAQSEILPGSSQPQTVKYQSAYEYQQMHVEALVAHGEMLRRRGDTSISSYPGTGDSSAISDAIRFVIANPSNPSKSWPWKAERKGTIWVTRKWYFNLEATYDLSSNYTYPTGFSGGPGGIRAGELIPFARLTFDWNSAVEDPSGLRVPGVPAPGQLSVGLAIDETFPRINHGWKPENNAGTWSVSNGAYTLTNPANTSDHNSNIAVHNAGLGDNFALRTRARVVGTSSSFNDLSVLFSYVDRDNYGYVSFNESNDDGTSGIFVVQNGAKTQLADITVPLNADTWYTVQIIKNGTTVEALLNGNIVATATSTGFGDGKVGFGSRNDAASFDDLLVYSFANQFVEDFADFSGWSAGGSWQALGNSFSCNDACSEGVRLMSPDLARNSVMKVRLRVGNTPGSYDGVDLEIGTQIGTMLSISLSEIGGVLSENSTLLDTIPPIAADTWYDIQVIRVDRFIDILLNGVLVASTDTLESSVYSIDTTRVAISSLGSPVEINVIDVLHVEEPPWFPSVPTSAPTSTPTNTPTLTPTNTPTNTPTLTPTNTPTNTPTLTPTNTPTPVLTCTSNTWYGDGTGSWGVYSGAITYSTGTTFTVLSRSSANAYGLILQGTDTVIASLTSVGSFYTTPASQTLKHGFMASSSTHNVGTEWVEIQVCTP